MNEIIANYSSTRKKDVTYKSPIFGKREVIETKKGTYEAAITTYTKLSDDDMCDPGKKILFSEDFSGEGEIVSVQSVINGGQAGEPFRKKTYSFLGVDDEWFLQN